MQPTARRKPVGLGVSFDGSVELYALSRTFGSELDSTLLVVLRPNPSFNSDWRKKTRQPVNSDVRPLGNVIVLL